MERVLCTVAAKFAFLRIGALKKLSLIFRISEICVTPLGRSVCVCVCVVYRNISKELSDFGCMEFANIFCNAHEPEIKMFTFKLIKNGAKKLFSELEPELQV